jgi:putative DNA primase/helicase
VWQQNPGTQQPAVLPDHLLRLLTSTSSSAPAAAERATPVATPKLATPTEPSDTQPSPSLQPTGDASAYWLRQAVAKVEAGAGRNNTGFWLAGQLRDDGVDQQAASQVLQQYVATVGSRGTHPFTEREALASLEQAYAREPREPAQRRGRLPAIAPLTSADECTDTGNAKRLALTYGGVLRFVAEWGGWLAYENGVWRRHESALAKRYAHETIQAIQGEATAALTAGDADRYRRLTTHLSRSLNAARLHAMLDVAQMYLAAHPADFDRDSWLLNLQNGTLNLQTGQLQPHQADDMLTRQAPVNYDPQAEAPAWVGFLNNVFHRDEALIGYVQRALGYSCTAETREQAFFICYGSGGNGKTTLFNAMAKVLGPYSKPLKADVLMARASVTGPGPDPELADVVGARFVTAQEPRGMTLDTPRLKELTGSDAVQVRELRRAPFTFVPQFKLWLSVNERPSVPETTVGIWRRIRLIPFTARFRGYEDKSMPAKLAAETSGILNWLLAGVRAWLDDGLGMVPAVQEATATYQAEEDAYAPFFSQVLTPAGHDQRILLKEAYAAFTAWCDSEGVQRPSEQDFPKEAERHGYTKVMGHARTRHLAGCALAPARFLPSSSSECGASSSASALAGDDGDDTTSVLDTPLKSAALEHQLENQGDIVTTVTQKQQEEETRPAQRRAKPGEVPLLRISPRFYSWLQDEAQLDDDEIDALTADELDVLREEYELG